MKLNRVHTLVGIGLVLQLFFLGCDLSLSPISTAGHATQLDPDHNAPVQAFGMDIVAGRAANGTVHEVLPSGDTTGQTDADNIQATIDAAGPGDTVLLKAGEFYFGKIGSIAEMDFQINTANQPFNLSDETAIDGWFYSIPEEQLYQSLNLHVNGIIVRGETAPGDISDRLPDGTIAEKPLTTLIALPKAAATFPFSGHSGSIVINAMNITLADLRLNGFQIPVQAFSPGFDIRNIRFDECGQMTKISPDGGLTYQDPSNPVKSLFRNNVYTSCIQAPHFIGSEMVVSNNRFEFNSILGIFVGNTWHTKHPPDSIDWSRADNNLIEGNEVLKSTHVSFPGIGFLNGCWAFIRLASTDDESKPMLANKVINNVLIHSVQSNSYLFNYGFIQVEFNQMGAVVSGNTIINSSLPSLWGDVEVWGNPIDCSILNNDYTQSSSALGWAKGFGCIMLYGGHNNFVFEAGNFPLGTGNAKQQVIDLGIDNRVVGHPANHVSNPGIGVKIQELKQELEEALAEQGTPY